MTGHSDDLWAGKNRLVDFYHHLKKILYTYVLRNFLNCTCLLVLSFQKNSTSNFFLSDGIHSVFFKPLKLLIQSDVDKEKNDALNYT